jgi:SAM-dependent methyltransferase
MIERLLKRAGVTVTAQRWLDVGCGRGELLELAGSSFAQAMGCDPSAAMLSSCAPFKVHKQLSPVELPFENSSVDFVTAVCVYHHVHGRARALLSSEIRRVLAPGGFFCIIEHNPAVIAAHNHRRSLLHLPAAIVVERKFDLQLYLIQLRKALTILDQWCEESRVRFGEDKTKMVVFCGAQGSLDMSRFTSFSLFGFKFSLTSH